MLVYHIVLPDAWAAFDTGLYRAASLETEGFIHCSFADQLDAVIERYYGDMDRVVVLEIDTDRLMARTLNESSTNREIYPHVYGPINRDAIIGIEERRKHDR
jgi:uncharacterized protein (DUF952 family)